MEIYGIDPANYQNFLIKMIYDSHKHKPFIDLQVLKEFVRLADEHGNIIRRVVVPEIMVNLRLTLDQVKKCIFVLKTHGHIGVKGNIIYINAKYKAVRRCCPEHGGDGLFIISPKKLLLLTIPDLSF